MSIDPSRNRKGLGNGVGGRNIPFRTSGALYVTRHPNGGSLFARDKGEASRDRFNGRRFLPVRSRAPNIFGRR